MDEFEKIKKRTFERGIESLIEIIIGFGILTGINLVWFGDDPGFLNQSLHPFLFLTILIAARYGTFEGFFTGILSAMIYMLYLFYGQNFYELLRSFEWVQVLPAYIFIITGVLIGEIRQMANNEFKNLYEKFLATSIEKDVLREKLEQETETKEQLETRILSEEDAIEKVYTYAKEIETFSFSSTLHAIAEMVQKFTGAESCSIYLTNEADELILEKYIGIEEEGALSKKINIDTPFIKEILESKRVVFRKNLPIKKTEIDFLMACPIYEEKKEEPLGLIFIHKIPFIKLNLAVAHNLWIIGGWAATSLRKVMIYDEKKIDDEETQTYNFRYLKKRLEEEISRYKRYNSIFSLVIIDVKNTKLLHSSERKNFIREFGKKLVKIVRNVDVVSSCPQPDRFLVLLPSTNYKGATNLLSRINSIFWKEYLYEGSRYSILALKTGIASAESKEKISMEEILKEAEKMELYKE